MHNLTTKATMPGPCAPAFRFTTSLIRIAPGAFVAAAVAAAASIVPLGPLAAQGMAGMTRSGERIAQANQAPAQQPPRASVQPPASVRPTPSQLELAKLLWSTTAAVDHANTSGNYSVLRDISAQRFQMNFNPARLTEIFSGLRSLNVDLSNALLVPPTYFEAPTMVSNDVFRVRGMFQLRPIAIGFDVYYQWEQGRWKLFGIDLQPQQMTEAQPGPASQ